MRAAAELFMPDSCQIRANGSGSSGGYSTGDNWGTIATVACALHPAKSAAASERYARDRIIATCPYILVLPHGTVITEENQVIVGGKTFQVAAVDTAHSHSVDVVCGLERV